jgi:protein O-mannosyl-transferase
MRLTRLDLGIALLLAAGTAISFAPAFSADFIGMDDPYYVRKNPRVNTGLTAENAAWAWGFSFHQSNWHPLTWLSLQLDASLWRNADGRPNPLGFHLTSVLLHAANAALLFFALQALTGARWRSAAVAALFAVHPLRVESVVWVSERKDVLSIFFGLLALWAYARYARRGGLGRYSAVAALLALSLLSKPTLVTLPFLMLVLDWWPLERLGKADIGRGNSKVGTSITTSISEPGGRPAGWAWLAVEKLPLLGIILASCVVTFVAQQRGGSVYALETLSFGNRLANALVAYGAYLFMSVWPANLALMYPYPGGGWPAWRVALAALAVGGLTALAVWQRRRRPYLLTGWLWYLGTLVPVIGLVQVGDQAFADRYSYFPLIGPCLALVWTASEAVPLSRVRWAAGAVAVLMLALAALTWHQASYWKDDLVLWFHTLDVTGKNAYAYNTIGTALETRGQMDKAAYYYEQAAEANPGYPTGQYNFGRVIRRQKHDAEANAKAIEHIRAAVRADPRLAEARDELAKALSEQGAYAEAEEQFREALRLRPESTLFHTDLGWFLEVMGRDKEALDEYQQAARLNPGDGAAQTRLGRFLGRRGELPQAIECFRRAVELQPGLPEPARDLGIALEKAGRAGEAVTCFRHSVELAPEDIRSRVALARTLGESGDVAGAGEEYRRASRQDPNWPDGMAQEAWRLATHPYLRERDGEAAVRAAQSACSAANPPPTPYLDVLAAAYAEAGHYADAAATAEKALAAANAAGKPDLARAIADRLALYRANHPFHQPAPAAPGHAGR